MENKTITEALNRANSSIFRDQPLVHAYTDRETKHDTNMFFLKYDKQKETCASNISYLTTNSIYFGGKIMMFVLKLNCRSEKKKINAH